MIIWIDKQTLMLVDEQEWQQMKIEYYVEIIR